MNDSVNFLTWEWSQPILVGTILLLSSAIFLAAFLVMKVMDVLYSFINRRRS